MPKHDSRRDTAAGLRGDLDAGRGRDKMAAPDPAAAPLGTDDEAAGTPITHEQASRARAEEIRGAADSPGAPPAMTDAADPHGAPLPRRKRAPAIYFPPSQRSSFGRPLPWVIGALVVALAIWLLLRLFG